VQTALCGSTVYFLLKYFAEASIGSDSEQCMNRPTAAS